ncbi:MAG: L-aspartate oxidase [Deltaproteobacteria bacterium TMED58]|nr:L-aspartate oxidase [Deltaproteobacteria bacterium TMED58]
MNKSSVTEVKTDFLIIGSGLSGLYAAIYASKFGKVALITKSSIQESNSYWAQGGIAAAINSDDSTEIHKEDTLSVGCGLNNLDAVNIMVSEGTERVLELINQGMSFDRAESGFDFGIEGGHSRRRILHALGNETGKAVVDFLSKEVQKNNKVKIYENSFVIDLFSDSKTCFGCLVFSDTKKNKISIHSKSTILATGGACGLYSQSSNPSSTSGDGIALGLNAGATVKDMEFIQFHPTVFSKEGAKNFLISEAIRGEGGQLINHSKIRFMENYSKQLELAPRDIVARAIFNEMRMNGEKNVFLSLKHLKSSLIKNRFKNTFELCLREGLDITKDDIPVSPAAHYMIGGIKTNAGSQTNIKNLYACGEVACVGAHGANRLASNSLLECLVFAKRAIDSSLKLSKKEKQIPRKLIEKAKKYSLISSDKKVESYLNYRISLSQIINNYVGILRNKKDLLLALNEISSIKKKNLDEFDLIDKRLMNLKSLTYLITKSALLREESRGAHIREDFSSQSNKWLKHINWKLTNGTLRFSYSKQ